ncbi:T9SS type A sorting domain-containing protein [Fulvivirgaceae bacterium BMA10]|uniref:T9SS type A sorting domain-containing protein n=1 Tax=Splendidivirga corallicola TaxID=3051826 RepID=A0ABT8KQE7_9BACT|nr:T9SS type A sorting domain-containing protein [Fulvivirgaceae bacterium BMA10]
MNKFKTFLVYFTILFFCSCHLNATHLKGGAISLRSNPGNNLSYIIILSFINDGSGVAGGSGTLMLGDGQTMSPESDADSSSTRVLYNGDILLQYFLSHTFSGPGSYQISYLEQNRNAGILNMTDAVNTSFYIESNITIDPFLGISEVELDSLPSLIAQSGLIYQGRFSILSKEGDSIVYKIITPRQDTEREVSDYRQPNHISFQGSNEAGTDAPSLNIELVNGNILWNSPGLIGSYTIALKAEKWRKANNDWFFIGDIVLDFQVDVADPGNDPPQIFTDQAYEVVAGEELQVPINVVDSQNDGVTLNLSGEIFELQDSPATLTQNPVVSQQTPLLVTLDWQTISLHIRDEPYTFKIVVQDNPDNGPSLSSVRVIRIWVRSVTDVFKPILYETGPVLYPNPVKNVLNIDIGNETLVKPINIKIYNQYGQLCVEKVLKKNSAINISKLAEGHYFVYGRMANGKIVRSKIIKQ